jgi:hypothetical protein
MIASQATARRMRKTTLILALILLTLSWAPSARASQRGAVMITTEKPFGPSPGSFSATGAISDSGTFFNTRIAFGGVGAPNFVSVHVTQEFDGAFGSFTLRADIKETPTAGDPNVATDEGTWAVISGTGAYSAMRGQGQVTGTADENTGVISRTYTGTVHFH